MYAYERRDSVPTQPYVTVQPLEIPQVTGYPREPSVSALPAMAPSPPDGMSDLAGGRTAYQTGSFDSSATWGPNQALDGGVGVCAVTNMSSTEPFW